MFTITKTEFLQHWQRVYKSSDYATKITETEADEIYLEYKQAINNISKEMPKLIDRRMFEQKTMEFHSKKNAVVKRILEMPK